MGNYKSRPTTSCVDELKKKISEGYSVVRSRLKDDLNATETSDIGNWCELQLACSRGDVDTVAGLLNDESVNIKTDRGLTLVHLCCVGGSTAAMNLVIQKQRKLLQLSKNEFSPLHLAAYKNDLEILTALCAAKIDINQAGYYGVSALHIAAMCGYMSVIRFLLANGANINAVDLVKFTPLHLVCYFGHEEVVECLLQFGADINKSGSVGDRPLHLSAAKGFLRTTQLLLEGQSKADVNVKDDEEHRPLHFCCKNGHVAVLNYLLQPQLGVELNATNIYGDTPMHFLN